MIRHPVFIQISQPADIPQPANKSEGPGDLLCFLFAFISFLFLKQLFKMEVRQIG
jgi:hypothetical protein